MYINVCFLELSRSSSNSKGYLPGVRKEYLPGVRKGHLRGVHKEHLLCVRIKDHLPWDFGRLQPTPRSTSERGRCSLIAKSQKMLFANNQKMFVLCEHPEEIHLTCTIYSHIQGHLQRVHEEHLPGVRTKEHFPGDFGRLQPTPRSSSEHERCSLIAKSQKMLFANNQNMFFANIQRRST